MRAMHSSSSATSMSPTPDLRQWTREPPSSSCVTSSPIAARTRCGPGQRHRAAALDHRDEVGQARDVGGAGGARAHQRGDLRDHPAHHHLLAEQVARAGEQRADRLLDARARRVEQPHERHALLQRQLAQARDLQLAGHPHRAGHHREVVGADAGHPAVDAAVAGDHPVGGRVAAVHRALGEVRLRMDAQLGERARRRPAARSARARSACRPRAGARSAPPRRRAAPARAARQVLGERAHAAHAGSTGLDRPGDERAPGGRARRRRPAPRTRSSRRRSARPRRRGRRAARAARPRSARPAPALPPPSPTGRGCRGRGAGTRARRGPRPPRPRAPRR